MRRFSGMFHGGSGVRRWPSRAPSSRAFPACPTRADYGIYRPLLSALRAREYALTILAGGTHGQREFGHTLDEIVADDWGPIAIVDHYTASDDKTAIASSCGRAVQAFAEAI